MPKLFEGDSVPHAQVCAFLLLNACPTDHVICFMCMKHLLGMWKICKDLGLLKENRQSSWRGFCTQRARNSWTYFLFRVHFSGLTTSSIGRFFMRKHHHYSLITLPDNAGTRGHKLKVRICIFFYLKEISHQQLAMWNSLPELFLS